MLKLKEINRINRPFKVEELSDISSWKANTSEFIGVMKDSPSGLSIIDSGKNGARTGALFLKHLTSSFSSTEGLQVVRGVIAEPINNSGWFFPFLGQALSGDHEEVPSHKEILANILDVSERCGSIAIVIDGLDLVDKNALVGDLVGALRLLTDGGVKFMIFASLGETTTQWLAAHDLLRSFAVIYQSMPLMSAKEIQEILKKRVQDAGLEFSDYSKEVEASSIKAYGDVGRAMELFLDSVRPAATVSAPARTDSVRSKPVAKSRQVLEDLMSSDKNVKKSK